MPFEASKQEFACNGWSVSPFNLMICVNPVTSASLNALKGIVMTKRDRMNRKGACTDIYLRNGKHDPRRWRLGAQALGLLTYAESLMSSLTCGFPR